MNWIPNGLFSFGFPNKIVYLPSPHCVLLHVLTILSPDFIILVVFGDAYILRNFLLCSFLHAPVTSSLLGWNVLCTLLECRQSAATFLFWVDHSCQSRPWQWRTRIFPKICYGWQPEKMLVNLFSVKASNSMSTYSCCLTLCPSATSNSCGFKCTVFYIK